MTHTTVEFEHCVAHITNGGIEFWVKKAPEDPVLVLSLSYLQFDEILAAVARTEEFIERP